MTTLAVQQVRPAGMRLEALLLAMAVVVVVGFLALWVHAHGRSDTIAPLHEWQVSAFETLAGADQAIYNALYTAREEILYLYDDLNLFNAPGEVFRWPSIPDLGDALLPPFVQDQSWEQNGALQWQLHEPLAEGEMQGSVMYLGTGGSREGQGSFLLVIGHVHAGLMNNNSIVIWWNPGNRVQMPQSGFRDGLILQGWREVVPHSGAQEYRRIFGSDAGATAEDAAAADRLVDELFGD